MRCSFDNKDFCGLYIWGNGKLLRRYFNYIKDLNIVSIVDSDPNRQGYDDVTKLICVSPEHIRNDYFVILAIEDGSSIEKVGSYLDDKKIKWCHIIEVVDDLFKKRQDINIKNSIADKKIAKFIDVMIPVPFCNFQCRYCYLQQLETDYRHLPNTYHDVDFIRHALRKERLKGSAFINLCGVGETLLFPNIIALTRSLVDEGHFIQIVTNASITKVIHEFIDSDISANKVFFKCSLHYMELKKRGLLKQYAMNVKALMEKGFSITVELVPHDELIEWIDEIKSYCLESFHALPHVTVTRDESKGGIPIDSLLDEEEYRRIWGSFGSALFDVKMDYRKKYEDCHAGLWAVELNLATGELYKCTNNPRLCNIYENIDVEIPFEKVGNECCLPYCFNCHAYITLGLVPGIDAPTYLEMRDRVTDGKRWITDDMREIFRQKLYENNTRV